MPLQQIDVPIVGMDCAECTVHVRQAIAALPGVENVNVLLASEKAIVTLDPTRVNADMICRAVTGAGYAVAAKDERRGTKDARPTTKDERRTNDIGLALVVVFGAVLFVVIVGEWLGLFEAITARVPLWLGAGLALAAGAPIFWNVLRAAWRRQIISHTLMSLGVLAALVVGQWLTALIVVFFMYVGDLVERLTTERARGALRDLNALAPHTARVERDGVEQQVEIGALEIGDIVVVRPGEQIPVDGEVVSGQATINQAAITGEPMPVEARKGSRVFAATIAELGSLRVRAARIGSDTTFGQVIQLVEQAEANRADVQRFADRFSAVFLPIVLAFAAVTFLVRRDPLATATVLIVACSCSIALATPVAMLASIGAAARRGILIKGGKVIEALARADVLLVDKTGTLTTGKPVLTEVIPLNGVGRDELLALAAAVERDSEHPLAKAICEAANQAQLQLHKVNDFEAVPGVGVRGKVGDRVIQVRAWERKYLETLPHVSEQVVGIDELSALIDKGTSVMLVTADSNPIGVLAAKDTPRAEMPDALRQLCALGIWHIELLTGDNERAAARLAEPLGMVWRANLLPQDKIRIVREYQAQGRCVVMVGDGVNDAPALAQADIGIAMGGGTDIARAAAHVILMRDDWQLVPETLALARRTMRVVKLNLGFTGVYNLVGLSLAALGILPPVLAAAAQSLPDLGIMGNSARLLRIQKE